MKKLTKIRLSAWHAQSGTCFYCHQPMWDRDAENFARQHGLSKKQARRFKVTAEHLCARSAGGRDAAENIVAACLYCNSHRHKAKRPLGPESYARLVRNRLQQGKWHGFIANHGITERLTKCAHSGLEPI